MFAMQPKFDERNGFYGWKYNCLYEKPDRKPLPKAIYQLKIPEN